MRGEKIDLTVVGGAELSGFDKAIKKLESLIALRDKFNKTGSLKIEVGGLGHLAQLENTIKNLEKSGGLDRLKKVLGQVQAAEGAAATGSKEFLAAQVGLAGGISKTTVAIEAQAIAAKKLAKHLTTIGKMGGVAATAVPPSMPAGSGPMGGGGSGSGGLIGRVSTQRGSKSSVAETFSVDQGVTETVTTSRNKKGTESTVRTTREDFEDELKRQLKAANELTKVERSSAKTHQDKLAALSVEKARLESIVQLAGQEQMMQRESAQAAQRRLAAIGLETKARRSELAQQLVTQRQEQRAAAARVARFDRLEKVGYVRESDQTREMGGGRSRREQVVVKTSGESRKRYKLVEEFGQVQTRTGMQTKLLSAQLTDLDKNLKMVGQRASWATRNFIDNTKTVVAWASSVVAYRAALAILRGTAAAVIDLQRKSATLGIVLRESFGGGQVGTIMKLRDAVLELAVAHGREADEAADAAIRFARLGLTRKQILEAVTVAMQAANVAEIQTGEAAEALSAIMASFNMQVSQLPDVLNKLNSLSNKWNVTNKDLLNGIARVGPLAEQAGLSFEELIAIIGTGVGVTGRAGAEFGNAIKSILVSLSNPEIQGKLEDLFNFNAKDNLGQLKDASDILRDMSVQFAKLNQADQQQLLQIVGRKQQASRLAVILGQFTTIQRNTIRALEDENATMQENAAITSTLKARLTGLKSAYEGLVLSMADSPIAGRITAPVGELIEFMTRMLQVGKALKPVVLFMIATMAMLTIQYARGAVAMGANNAQGGLLINTGKKISAMYRDLARIMVTWERATLKSGGANAAWVASGRRMNRAGNQMGGMLGYLTMKMGRFIRFTGFAFRALSGLAKGVVWIAAIEVALRAMNWVMEKVSASFGEGESAADRFAKSLQKIQNTATKFKTLKEMAEVLKETASVLDKSEFGKRVSQFAEVAAPELGMTRQELRIRIMADGETEGVLDKLSQRFASMFIESLRDQKSKLTREVSAGEGLVASLEQQIDAKGGQSQAPTKLNEQYKEARDALEGNMQALIEVDQQLLKLEQGALRFAMGLSEAKDIAKAIGDETKKLVEAGGGLGAVGKFRGDKLAAASKFAQRFNVQRMMTEGMDAKKAAMEQRASDLFAKLPDSPFRGDKSKWEDAIDSARRYEKTVQMLIDARRELDGVNQQLEPKGGLMERIKEGYRAPGRAWKERGGVGSEFLKPGALEQRREELNAEVNRLQAEVNRTTPNEKNQSIAGQMTRAGQASLELKEEAIALAKAQDAAAQAAKEHVKELEKEYAEFQRVQSVMQEFARRQDEISRLRGDTRASFAGSRVGTGPEQLFNEARQLEQMLDISSEREDQAATAARHSPDEDRRIQFQQQAFDEYARQNEIASRAEELRTQIVQRRASIEAEITNQLIQQNREVSEALAMATREDQLRAAMLARTVQDRGGRGFSGAEFQFFGQETKQAVTQFLPSAAPGTLNPMYDLEKERAQLDTFFEDFVSRLEDVVSAVQEREGVPIEGSGEAVLARGGVESPNNVAGINLNPTVNIAIADQIMPLINGFEGVALAAFEKQFQPLILRVNSLESTLRAVGVQGATGA